MMLRIRNLAFLLLVSAVLCADEPSKPVDPETKDSFPPQPPPTSQAPVSTSTKAPITPSTKPPPPEPTTSTPAPTTSTATPTTSKPTPPTTHTPPTPPPPTTTHAPTTTPAPTPTPPPTTPAPVTTPKPAPAIDSWTVKDTNGTVCITANMVIKIDVPYKTIENKTVSSPFMVDKVSNATAAGTCTGAANTENLILTWNNVTATFNFALNTSDHTYSLDSVNISILVNNVTFPNNTMVNMTELKLNYEGKLFSVPQNNSYTCATVPVLSLTGTKDPVTNTTVSGKLTVAHVHVQAFGKENSGKYRAPMDCASTQTPDIVPIAVGLVLAGLVVIVLVAYLIGRRQAQARGYLSM